MKKSRRQALGQHFLTNRAILRKIVAVIAPVKDDIVVEIGAGKGTLTTLLAEKAGRVIAIEKDMRLIPDLERAVPSNVDIVVADVLTLDFRRLLRSLQVPSLHIAGNLPYVISTPFLFRILDDRELFADAVFLLQKEVAERVAAGPGTKKYAPLSILLQNAFEVRLEFTVSPGSFSPPPKVRSALLSLRKRSAPLHGSAEDPLFRAFLRAAFAHRRKQLHKNLDRAVEAGVLDQALRGCGLAGTVRAEELSAASLVELFEALRPSLCLRP